MNPLRALLPLLVISLYSPIDAQLTFPGLGGVAKNATVLQRAQAVQTALAAYVAAVLELVNALLGLPTSGYGFVPLLVAISDVATSAQHLLFVTLGVPPIATVIAALAPPPDMGVQTWTCDADVMKKSATVPTSAHSVRYADIEYIGALGDSLTAGNGAGSIKGDIFGVFTEYRGLVFSVGGDRSLDTHVTVANVLKKFNPNLFGYSVGIGTAANWDISHLNVAEPGAMSADLLSQAQDLVFRIHEHPEIDYVNKWKLIHIFIGGNDMCAYCMQPEMLSPARFADNIKAAIQFLKDNLPKTIVTLTGMLDLSLLRQVAHNNALCIGVHLFECPCESNAAVTDQELHDASLAYMASEQELEDSGIFDITDDFTLVIQPLFEGLTAPPLNHDGTPNLDFFAADCFHFSQLGHAAVGVNLWDNIVEPVGSKNRVASVNVSLICPDASCPFVRTTKNSVNCAQYMTPSAN